VHRIARRFEARCCIDSIRPIVPGWIRVMLDALAAGGAATRPRVSSAYTTTPDRVLASAMRRRSKLNPLPALRPVRKPSEARKINFRPDRPARPRVRLSIASSVSRAL
jgi:hypothetical protein